MLTNVSLILVRTEQLASIKSTRSSVHARWVGLAGTVIQVTDTRKGSEPELRPVTTILDILGGFQNLLLN